MTGLHLSVSMRPENIFDSRQSRYLGFSEMGLTPGDPQAITQAHHWINTHFRAIHHNTPFLNLAQVLDIATRVFGAEHQEGRQPASNAELALLCAVLALGSLREQTFASATGKYRSLPTQMALEDLLDPSESPSSARSAPSYKSPSTGQSLFRLAQDELDQIEEPCETAVQALYLLHTFVSNTSMSRRSRDYVARAIMMAHEIGLNRRLPMNLKAGFGSANKRAKDDKHPARRRAILYLYVCFSDV